MSEHSAHARRIGVSTPCTAHHVNFGRGCLNCGWVPDQKPTTFAQALSEADRLRQERDEAIALLRKRRSECRNAMWIDDQTKCIGCDSCNATDTFLARIEGGSR